MRKCKRVSACVLAAVLACQTPLSTRAGSWVEESDGWYYEDGGSYLSGQWVRGKGGAFYYLEEDGRMAAGRLIKGDQDRIYYVDEDGVRVKSCWRQAGLAEDEGAGEYWYYFNANGEAVTGKKVIDGKKYFFDGEGRMLTGWVQWSDRESRPYEGRLDEKDGDVYYCLENGETASGWLKLAPPDVEDDSGEEFWYNFDGGKVRTNAKEGLGGQDYIFNKNGEMVTGWAYDDGGAWQDVNEDTDDGDMDRFKIDVTKFYFAREDGSLVKNGWIKAKCFDALTGDGDEDTAWYYFDKKGRMTGRQATASPSDAMEAADTEGAAVHVKVHKGNKGKYEVKTGGDIYNEDAPVVTIKKVDGKYYMFNTKGKLADGLIYIPKSVGRFERGYYNFDDSSALKPGDAVLEDGGTDFYYYFATEKDKGYSLGQGVTGVFKGRLYCEGLAVTAPEGTGWQPAYIEPRDGRKANGLFLVDETGRVKTGGAVTDEQGIQYKVEKKQGLDPKKRGYAISYRDSSEDHKGQSGYQVVSPEDEELVPVRPDDDFQYSGETGLYYPKGALPEA